MPYLPTMKYPRYQLTNHLDSASLELNETGEIISYEEYHPFGTTSYRSGRSEVEVSLKRYKYVFKELDNETGLYYYGMRYYAPWIARFISVDPLQFEYPIYTPFQYAGNKPISYIDLDGAEEHTFTKRFIKSRGNSILRKLVKTGSIDKMYSKFEDESIVNLQWDVGKFKYDTNASTFPTSSMEAKGVKWSIGIKVNTTTMEDGSDISIARTMVHELIHADIHHMLLKYTEKGIDNNVDFAKKEEMPALVKAKNELYKYYSEKVFKNKMKSYSDDEGVHFRPYTENEIKIETLKEAEHQYIAKYRRGDIVKALETFDELNGVKSRSGIVGKYSYSTTEFYEAMSWAGLSKSKEWDDLSTDKQNLYINIIEKEQNKLKSK